MKKNLFKISVICITLIAFMLVGTVAYAADGYIYPYPQKISGPAASTPQSLGLPEHYYAPTDIQPINNNVNNYWNYPWEFGIEKGWHCNSNGKYYYKGDGTYFVNQWAWIDGKYYKFAPNGYVYRNTWITENGSWFFADTDGVIVTGWRQIDNVWYYFIPEVGNLYGVMARNATMFVSGYPFGTGYFAFNDQGAIITNSWFGGHYYGSNGVRVE